MTIYLPLLICFLGLFIYLLTDKPKPSSIAKDMFWTGLLVTLLQVAGKTLEVLR